MNIDENLVVALVGGFSGGVIGVIGSLVGAAVSHRLSLKRNEIVEKQKRMRALAAELFPCVRDGYFATNWLRSQGFHEDLLSLRTKCRETIDEADVGIRVLMGHEFDHVDFFDFTSSFAQETARRLSKLVGILREAESKRTADEVYKVGVQYWNELEDIGGALLS